MGQVEIGDFCPRERPTQTRSELLDSARPPDGGARELESGSFELHCRRSSYTLVGCICLSLANGASGAANRPRLPQSVWGKKKERDADTTRRNGKTARACGCPVFPAKQSTRGSLWKAGDTVKRWLPKEAGTLPISRWNHPTSPPRRAGTRRDLQTLGRFGCRLRARMPTLGRGGIRGRSLIPLALVLRRRVVQKV